MPPWELETTGPLEQAHSKAWPLSSSQQALAPPPTSLAQPQGYIQPGIQSSQQAGDWLRRPGQGPTLQPALVTSNLQSPKTGLSTASALLLC